jgi:predicted N-acetyltransferase YhbS
MKVKQEEPKDYFEVYKLLENAFKDEPFSDHKEAALVNRLRNSPSFIPALSLVAEIDNIIVGYILLTKIKIINKDANPVTSLALAPVAVLKSYQGNGIGSVLIKTAHNIARELKYNSIVLLGHNNYYSKFGYEKANKYGIRLPFDVPEENCMVMDFYFCPYFHLPSNIIYLVKKIDENMAFK